MARNRRTSVWLTLLFGGLVLSFTQFAGAQDSADARALEEVAVNAQNDREFGIAIGKWEELIADHSTYSRIGNAELNCGKCYLESGDFEKAISHFKAATQKLDAKATVALPESYLFLGYSQYKRGIELQDADPEQANKLLSTATKTFDTQRKNFDKFEHNDQVCYFQGLTYEALAGLVTDGSDPLFEKAAESYEAMFAAKPDTDFKMDGLFFLGNVYERLAQYDNALQNYRDYLAIGQDDPSFTEVQYRTAHTLVQMAPADKSEQFKANLTEAKELFNRAASVENFAFQGDAQYQSALCSHRLGNLREAADEYQAIADADGEAATKSAFQAGRIFRSLGNEADTEKYLMQVINSGGKLANEAALQLVLAKLDANQAEQAFTIAENQLAKTDNKQPFVADLMLHKADAALMLDNRQESSPALYLELYEAFPEHRLTSAALYNAAFANLELERYDESEKLCEDFLAKFSNDPFTPDLLEVRADVHLLKKQYPESQKIFEELVRDFGDHNKVDTWKMRVGVVLSMQDKHDETIQWLTPLAGDFETASEKAEAWHWVGKSHLAKENFADAELALKRALDADPDWNFAPKSMLALSQAQAGLNKEADAQQTLTSMRNKFPEAPQILVADYRAAEAAYKSGEFETAAELYETIIQDSPDSEYVPFCKMGLAWSHLELKEFAKAESGFSEILKDYGDTNMAPQAMLGRGMSRRQNEQAEGAIADLQNYIDQDPKDGQLVEARYELGLAQTQLNQSKDAIKTFTDLIEDAPKHGYADRFHYELAWLYSNENQAEKSHEQFTAIAENFPDSNLAPEANFKIGEKAYLGKEYGDAVKAFRLCLNSGGPDALREKAAYRLGWCFYKQENFAQARENFKLQIRDFENGRYFADAQFMIAESHYNQGQMEEAFAGYVAAKKAIDIGGKVVEKNVWLTMLHGAVSGNKTRGFDQALAFANGLLESNASDGLKLEGWFEKGQALKGLQRNEQAIAAFSESAKDRAGEIGAKSRCMIGDVLLLNQEHDKAIDAYTNVFYGYGGSKTDEKLDPWQAYAYYHAALCSFARIQQARDAGNQELATKLASDASKLYEKLLAEHPASEFAAQARKNLETIKKL